MSRRLPLFVLLGLLTLLVRGVSAQSDEELGLGYMKGEAILRFDDAQLRPERQPALLDRLGCEIKRAYPRIGAFHVGFDPTIPVPVQLDRLRARRDVLWAHENALGSRGQTLPNDPGFSNSYALQNTGQWVGGSSGTADADIDAPEAWDIIKDASSVRIAVVDSGLRDTHLDLSANVWNNPGEIPGNNVDDDQNGFVDDVIGWDFLDDDSTPTDFDGHGTNVTGCIAMVGDNGLGGTGVCWSAQVMVLKDGDTVPQVALSAAAIEYAAMNGAVVCNFSTGYGSGNFPLLQQAVNVAENAGMILCVSAGNSGANIDSGTNAPATYANANVVVVAATDNDDDLAGFSNFGPNRVDVAAPGVSIYTTSRFTNGAYSFASGTSFSAPIVTGCVALMRAFLPGASHQAISNALIASSDPVPGLANMVAANGRVNLAAALGALAGAGAPNPDPMGFAQAPNLRMNGGVEMVAITAGPGLVEYRFDLVTTTGTGGNSSAWQSSSVYFDGGLSPDAQFAWTVRARSAMTLVATQPSAPIGVWTPANPPGSVNMTAITNGSFDVITIGDNGNPSSTEYALMVNGLWAGPGGALQMNPFYRPRQTWNGVTVKGLQPQSAYVVRAQARNGQGTVTDLGPPSVLSTGLLGPAAFGVVNDQLGAPEPIFRINDSTGGAAHFVGVPVGAPFDFEVLTPTTMSGPANFAIIAWWGIPERSWEFEIPSFFGRGTLVFTPCDVNPGLPSFNVVSSFGSVCGEIMPGAAPTPWFAGNPGIGYPLPDLTLQAIVEETPGVFAAGNAIVFRYQ